MSRLTGYLYAQKALEICAREKGVFCAANESFLPAGRALIIGLGNIGLSVFRYLSDLKVGLVVVANSDAAEVNRRANDRFQTTGIDYFGRAGTELIRMDVQRPQTTKDQIAARLPGMDIVINCAVRRTNLDKEAMDFIIDKSMVGQMESGSLVCDATANDRDFIETCVSSASLHDTYRECGVIHYNCDHIPALVPRTATELLTERTFYYILKLANSGVIEALRADRYLQNAACCYQGHLTHRLSAERKRLPYQPIHELISQSRQMVS
jgi:alanine dehydrogenase